MVVQQGRKESTCNPHCPCGVRRDTFLWLNHVFFLFQLIEEKCTYRVSPENSKWTQCERQAWITSNVFGFAYALQALGLERFRASAVKTVKGFEFVLNKMYNPEVLTPAVTEVSKLAVKKEKLKTTAKKATEIAKEKAAPVMAKYGGTAAS